MQFQRLCAIPTLPGFSLVRSAVANDGSLLFLFAETSIASALSETEKRGVGSFPRSRAAMPVPLRLVRMTSSATQTIELPSLDLAFPHVDVFPDGRVLIAGARCAWRSKDDFDRNAAVIQPATGEVRRILLGDGLGLMQIDSLGRVWAGYFDEGIFGNFGWGEPDGPTPIGRNGLVCFSASGEKIWEFSEGPPDGILDCCALNVSGANAAIFVDTDSSPFCTISDKFEPTYWKPKLEGCQAFALSETQVLFSGQYGDPDDAAYLASLTSGEIGEISRVRMLMPDGSARPDELLMGRGNSLYRFDAEHVYRLSLG